MSAEPHHSEEVATDFWSNPVDHFRPNLKAFTLYSDRHYFVDRYQRFLDRRLGAFYMAWWNPLYQAALWYPQRNRNLFLIENNMNYRPYKWRRNDEDRTNPY